MVHLSCRTICFRVRSRDSDLDNRRICASSQGQLFLVGVVAAGAAMSGFHVDTISTESSPSFQAPPFQPTDYETELDKLHSMSQQAEGRGESGKSKGESGKSKSQQDAEKKGIQRLPCFEVKDKSSDGQEQAEEEAGGEEDEDDDDEMPATKKKPAGRGRGRGQGRKKSSSSDVASRVIKRKKRTTMMSLMKTTISVPARPPDVYDTICSRLGFMLCSYYNLHPAMSCRPAAKRRRANPGKLQHGNRRHERAARRTRARKRPRKEDARRKLPFQTSSMLWRA